MLLLLLLFLTMRVEHHIMAFSSQSNPRAPRPRHGKDNDALVVEVGEGEAGIAKKKVFSIRRAFARIFFWYPGGY